MTGPAGKPLAVRLSEGLGSNVEHGARGRYDDKGHLPGGRLATMTFVRKFLFNINERYRETARMPTVLLRLASPGFALSGELLVPRLNRFWKLVPQMGILADAQRAFLVFGRRLGADHSRKRIAYSDATRASRRSRVVAA